MKILIDIGHPAHVHFFQNPIIKWRELGHDIIVTSRVKEMTTGLLDTSDTEHLILSSVNDGTKSAMLKELVGRDFRLLRIVLKEKPDVMVGIGGIYIAHTGFVTRTPSIVFYDTENAHLSNLITYPFCTHVVVPQCYQAWLPPWNIRYRGYHELSYLHPARFHPNHDIAVNCGLDPARPTYLLRIVSWKASHDMSEKGWSLDLLWRVMEHLKKRGKVIISSESNLPEKFSDYLYRGRPEEIHHLMAFLKLFVGESATMASECAVLGVPSIYAAETGRGYTDEQEEKYKLVCNVKDLTWDQVKKTLNEILNRPDSFWREKRELLLSETIDVCDFVTNIVDDYPASFSRHKNNS